MMKTNHQVIIEQAIRDILEVFGDEIDNEERINTPKRVAQYLLEMTSGYYSDPDKIINKAYFPHKQTNNDIVLVRDISFQGLCAHHMLPFIGKAHIAYIPEGKVIGLSKIPRIVQMYSHRLQIQERMTQQIAELLNQKLNPRGVAVIIEGFHLCCRIRGVKDCSANLVTSAMLGCFNTQSELRSELFRLITIDKGFDPINFE